MNKKKIFTRIFAVLLAASLLSACGQKTDEKETSDTSKTTETSATDETLAPEVTPQDFAESLQSALMNEVRSSTALEIRETHRLIPTSSMTKSVHAEWETDFSDSTNPIFFYSSQRNASSEEPESLLFYDGGFLYVKDDESRYRQPTPVERAIEKIPLTPLSEIFGNTIAEVFAKATVTNNADGTCSAKVDLPLDNYTDKIVSYLSKFGFRSSGEAYEAEGNPSPLTVSVTLSAEGTVLSYTLETVMRAPQQNPVYPITYTFSAVCQEIGENFSVQLPDAAAREKYTEAEPEITDISPLEFLNRFKKSDEKSARAVFTELTTQAAVTYHFSNGHSATVPILNITSLDLSNPNAPKVAIIKTENMLGTLTKTEIYYKDDMYYYSNGIYRAVMPYPAEEYLANVEASAKEKEKEGISTVFLTEDMMKSAVLTVNSDQSVHALIHFDGKTQEKNINYIISSTFNDDFTKMQNVKFLDTEVGITLNRFNDMISYNITVTVSAESGGTAATVTYTVNRSYVYDENPREIDFPDDLDTWVSDSQNGESVL